MVDMFSLKLCVWGFIWVQQVRLDFKKVACLFQVNGKLMCWLCDQAYKRVLAKTRKAQDLVTKPSPLSSSVTDSSSKQNTPTNNGQVFSASQPQSLPASFEGMTVLERLTKLATSGGSSQGNSPSVEADRPAKVEGEDRLGEKLQSFAERLKAGEDGEGKDEEKHQPHHRHHHKKHHHHHSKRRHSK